MSAVEASPRRNVATVSPASHDGDHITDFLDLIHPMRDEDDARSVHGEAFEDQEEPIARRDVQGGRWPRPESARAARATARRAIPRDCRSLNGRPPASGIEARDLAKQFGQHVARPRPAASTIDALTKKSVAAEPDVLRAPSACRRSSCSETRPRSRRPLPRGCRADRSAPFPGFRSCRHPGVGNAGEDLHHRALARAVLANDGVNLAWRQRQRTGTQGLGRAVGLREVRNRQRAGCVNSERVVGLCVRGHVRIRCRL